jgi:hypothetical protein
MPGAGSGCPNEGHFAWGGTGRRNWPLWLAEAVRTRSKPARAMSPGRAAGPHSSRTGVTLPKSRLVSTGAGRGWPGLAGAFHRPRVQRRVTASERSTRPVASRPCMPVVPCGIAVVVRRSSFVVAALRWRLSAMTVVRCCSRPWPPDSFREIREIFRDLSGWGRGCAPS